jgi:hypothetical protein
LTRTGFASAAHRCREGRVKLAVAILAAIALAISGAGGAQACAHDAAPKTDVMAHHAAGHDADHGDHGGESRNDCCPDGCAGGSACKGCIALSAIAAPALAMLTPSPLAAIEPWSDDREQGDHWPGEPPPPRT